MRFKKLTSIYLYFTIFASALSADRIYVNKLAAPDGDGTSWESAYQFLHDATLSVDAGDEVWIAKGTYYPDEGSILQNNTNEPFNLGLAVGIYGGFAGNETSLEQRDFILNETIINGSFFTNEDLTSVYDSTDPSGSGVGVSEEWQTLYGSSFSSLLFLIGDRITLDGLTIKNTVNCTYGNQGIISSHTPPTADASLLIKNCKFLYNYTADTPLFGNITNSRNTFYKFDNCKFEYNKGVQGNVAYGVLMTGSSVKLTNCVFSNNAFYYMFSYNSNLDATNCVFAHNLTSYTFFANVASETINCVFYANRSGSLFLNENLALNHSATNCTFSNNDLYTLADSATSGNFFLRNCIIDGSNEIRSTLFSNVNATNNSFDYFDEYNEPTLRSVNIIFGDLQTDLIGFGSGFVITDDPMFVDLSDVDGADNIWGTSDDGLRLRSTSPAIDLVNNNFLPTDTQDLDQDGNTTEALSLDITGNARKQGNAMDLGAYEFNSSEIGSFTLLSNAVTGGSVTPTGISDHFENSSIIITASPDEGYLFSTWSGDTNTTENPTALVMDRNKSVVAVFIQDDNDNDGDGLSNYAEAVIYGSDPNQIDTSGDGFNDKSIADAGFDPTQNYQGLITSLDYYSLDDIEDLRSGSVLLSNGPDSSAKLRLQIERTEDLINWTAAPEDIFEIEIPLSADKEFYRFAFPEE